MVELKEITETQVLRTVLSYCLFIIVLPVISFFTSKTFFFDGILGLSNIASNVYAAGVAIIILHLALGAFIYRTFFDTQVKSQMKAD